uniref:Uncharacterized protein n=1 Tax=Romanomermis culicivorax TaxID=13658 RepID=A0A915J9A8_ROMCU
MLNLLHCGRRKSSIEVKNFSLFGQTLYLQFQFRIYQSVPDDHAASVKIIFVRNDLHGQHGHAAVEIENEPVIHRAEPFVNVGPNVNAEPHGAV